MSSRVRREIRLIEEDDGWWAAIDEDVGVASQGASRSKALENLDEAVALHTGDAGEPIENEAEFLEEIGIDPDDVAGSEDRELPSFMQ